MTQLSLEAGYSVREIRSALEQMERMGYIHHEIFKQECNSCCGPDGGRHCQECGFSTDEKYNFWVLTERGQAAVNSRVHN